MKLENCIEIQYISFSFFFDMMGHHVIAEEWISHMT